MSILSRLSLWKKKTPPTHTWEFAPYAFEPGRVYVIELAMSEIELPEINALREYFLAQGLNVKLVLSRTGRGIHPVTVKRMTQEAGSNR